MKKTYLLVLVLALGMASEIVKADFTFGNPTNLGPIVNSSSLDKGPSISSDGLTLFFHSGNNRPGSYGQKDLWVTTRATTDDPWSEPVNFDLNINSSYQEGNPSISADQLSLYFSSWRQPEGYGENDLWMIERPTKSDPWSEPINLGPIINTSYVEIRPDISADGLTLFFSSDRPTGHGKDDLWITTRATTNDPWGQPVNLGPILNSSDRDGGPCISADGLTLFIESDRPGSYGGRDLYMTKRATTNQPWSTPVNLGPIVNSDVEDGGPSISDDGLTLYFHSKRPGGFGRNDLWQVSIEPVVDFNGDGIVNADDMCIMIEYWGTDEPLCDIGPTPFGDGIIDVQDLIVLAEHLFEEIPPVEEINVNEEIDTEQVELEPGQTLVFILESNPTTGYRWEVVEIDESILEQIGETEFEPSEKGKPPFVGAGGSEIFRFKAIGVGQMTLRLVYHRPWEEGVEPLKTISVQVSVQVPVTPVTPLPPVDRTDAPTG
jgi:predicted secreted protein/Tol biopolymer transport system component